MTMQHKLTKDKMRNLLEDQLARVNGILRLKPAWVARNSFPSGHRLGLKEEEYFVGERGWISERWLGSTTKADNPVGPLDEGLSYLNLDTEHEITLKAAVETIPELMMGTDYAQTYSGLGRLPKIYDYCERISFHYHQRKEDAALVGRNPKEEAYFFPAGVDLGSHPETFFGVHPFIAKPENREILLQHLIDWKDDRILQHSRAYHTFHEDGFHIPAGIPHAPGTALTVELQEDSDVFAVLQAMLGGKLVSKELMFKDIRREDRELFGERIVLNQIDWDLSGDPYFYENRHTPPQLLNQSVQPGGKEYWIFYNTNKFSGKKMVVDPGMEYFSRDAGVYSLLVWEGEGRFDGLPISAQDFDLQELFVCHQKATETIKVQNTGDKPLVIFKFFGPDINQDIPMIELYQP